MTLHEFLKSKGYILVPAEMEKLMEEYARQKAIDFNQWTHKNVYKSMWGYVYNYNPCTKETSMTDEQLYYEYINAEK